METKPLLFGLIGFFLGGLLVSFAATTFDKPVSDMSEMTQFLANKKGDEYDKAFLAYMIDHHRSAVDMAKLSATNAKHDEIKRLSNDILSAQNKEIAQMRQWQTDWKYTSGETDQMDMGH